MSLRDLGCRSPSRGESGELLVSTPDLMDRLAAVLPVKQRRQEAYRWMLEEPWSRPAVGGNVVDLQRMPYG